MSRTPIRALSLLLLLSGWFVASSMAPARAQDPKPAPEAKGGQTGQGGGTGQGQGEGQRPGPRGEGRRGRGPGEGPSLHNAMEQLQTETDRISATIADPTKNDVTLQGLGRMVTFAGASQNGQPKNLEEVPADAQAAHKLAFRRALVVLARDITEVELLVLDGKNAQAAEMFKARILASRDAGHEKFGGDEKEGH